MDSKLKVFLAIIGACSVIIEMLTPLAIALFWGYYFNLSTTSTTIILIIGGLATLFRAIKVGWLKDE